jgi:uncharacterized membrane protein YbhN (UPF0104 family)
MRQGLRLAVIAGVVGVLLFWRIDIADVKNYFTRELWFAILWVQPLIALGTVVCGARLSLLVNTPPAPLLVCVKAVILSYGLNVLLPWRSSELVKATYLRNQIVTPLSVGMAAVFLERLSDLIIVGFLAVLSITLLLASVNYVFVLLMIAALFVLVLIPRIEAYVIQWLHVIPWKLPRSFAERFLRHASNRIRDPQIGRALAYGVAIWVISFLSVTVFFHVAGGTAIGLTGALVVFVASTVGGVIPALPGGFGTYEAAVAFTLSSYGYSLEKGLALGLALHASQLLLTFGGALFITVTERTGVSSLAAQIRDSLKNSG